MELVQRTITGTDGPRLLIVAGVHGDEFEPMCAVDALVERLEPAKLRGTVTLIPIVHRNAFERGSRRGEDGLDLARTCPGRADGTITERVAFALSRQIRECDFFIDLHTGGAQYRLLPLSGYILHENPTVLERQRQMARAFNLPIVWGTDPTLEGRSLSVARDANVPAIYTEHGGGNVFQQAAVDDCVEGCLNVMISLGMLEGKLPPSRVEHVVEDARPGAGHLQVNHPSPVAGLFTPAVELGQRVERGQRLGTVIDPLNASPQHVECRQSGLVMMLRALARVESGDALATILEIDSTRGRA